MPNSTLHSPNGVLPMQTRRANVGKTPNLALPLSETHKCAANGCCRQVQAKYDFCFLCFGQLPGELRDGVTRWKARVHFSNFMNLESNRRRHKDALDAAREFLRKRASEICEGRR